MRAMNLSRRFSCLLLMFAVTVGARATTVIYPVGAIDDLWKYPAEEFREKYAGINVTGLDVNDEGWYVRYRHENLTYFFGPIADREEARKKMWDLETVRDAAIRNRPALSSSQIDFVKFSYSGVYGAAGNTPFTGKKGANGQGGDGDQANGSGTGKDGRDGSGGSGQNSTDKAGNGNGSGNSQDGSGTIAMDAQGNMIGEKLGSLDGSGQGQGGQGSQGSSQKGGKGSQNSQRTGAGANSGQSGQNGQMASSGGQQGGQSGQSASQSSSGSSGQSGGQGSGSNSSSASNSSQSGTNSGSGQPSQGGGGSGGGSGQPGGSGNPLQLIVGLLRGILGL